MAQTNPVDQSSSHSTTGAAHAPLETGSSYRTEAGTGIENRSTGQKVRDMFSGSGSGHSSTMGTTTTKPTTTTTTHPTSNGAGGVHTTSNTSGSSAQNAVREAGSGVGGILAGIHGVGEKVRGEFNGAVDEAFHEDRGVARNAAVANVGDAEMNTGHFAAETKNREGAIPGDQETRKYHS